VSLFGLFATRGNPLENPAVPLTDPSLWAWMCGPPTDSGIPVSETTAMNTSAVFRATSLVAGLCGALPIRVLVKRTQEPVSNVLLDDPHPDLTPLELWRLTGAYRCLWGNAYLQKVRTRGSGRIAWLEPISPSRVTPGRAAPIEANPSGKVFRVVDDHGVARDLTANEILHIPGLAYDSVAGFSPVRLAAQAIGLALAAERYGARLFGSGNLLNGLLQTDQRLTRDQAERLQERWQRRIGGVDRAHTVAVLDSGAKFASLTMPNDSAQFLESRNFQVTEIARFFGIPPYLMFQTEKTTSWGTSLEQQSRGFTQYDLRTMWLAPTEQRITKELLPRTQVAKYDMTELMRGDSQARAQYYAVMRQIGALSADDIRAMEDLPPLPDGQGRSHAPLPIPAPVGAAGDGFQEPADG